METQIESRITDNVAKILVGEGVKPIQLMSIEGDMFDSETLKGKRYMISFFRFASCPFCNLRVHDLVKRFDELGKEFTIVAIFDSSLDNLQQHAQRHKSPFPILADENNDYYRQYGIKYSILGMLKGMFMRFPSLMKAMFVHGYFPLRIKGRMTTMPADFLVDENGVIKTAYYGKDEGDHLSFDVIKQFANR